jgi:hypothetical protein
MDTEMSVFEKQIQELKKKIDLNKLVIFVGAGVSKNSGLPDWKELIEEIATKIKYPNNYTCNNKKSKNKNVECEYTSKERKIHFCSDEYLKIPQYLYNKNKTHKSYWDFLDTQFGETQWEEFSPNLIHEIIFDLKPVHIITTNYDPLLERSENSRKTAYKVICSDKEMLEKSRDKNKYIIKMHGDYKAIIDRTKNFVLKEDDYLRYEENFTLISTFIKSLLVTHTFLFVGYSVNDYNFKQIIDWVKNLEDKSELKKLEIKHYLIRTEDYKAEPYEKEYLEKKHIEIIETYDLAIREEDNKFENPFGNRLYTTLKEIVGKETIVDTDIAPPSNEEPDTPLEDKNKADNYGVPNPAEVPTEKTLKDSDDKKGEKMDSKDKEIIPNKDAPILEKFNSPEELKKHLIEVYKPFKDVRYIPYFDFLKIHRWEGAYAESLILVTPITNNFDYSHIWLMLMLSEKKTKSKKIYDENNYDFTTFDNLSSLLNEQEI